MPSVGSRNHVARIVQIVQNCQSLPLSEATIACGTPTTDANIAATTVYDARGRVQDSINALNQTTRVTYDRLDRPLRTIAHDVNGDFVVHVPTTLIPDDERRATCEQTWCGS